MQDVLRHALAATKTAADRQAQPIKLMQKMEEGCQDKGHSRIQPQLHSYCSLPEPPSSAGGCSRGAKHACFLLAGSVMLMEKFSLYDPRYLHRGSYHAIVYLRSCRNFCISTSDRVRLARLGQRLELKLCLSWLGSLMFGLLAWLRARFRDWPCPPRDCEPTLGIARYVKECAAFELQNLPVLANISGATSNKTGPQNPSNNPTVRGGTTQRLEGKLLRAATSIMFALHHTTRQSSQWFLGIPRFGVKASRGWRDSR